MSEPITEASWLEVLREDADRRSRDLLRARKSEAIQKAELLLCREEPEYWISRYVWLEDPHAPVESDRVFPLVLWPDQKRLIRFLLEGRALGRDRMVAKGRKVGVSWISVALLVHGLLFESHFLAKMGHRKAEEAEGYSTDSLMGKARFILEHLPSWMRAPGIEGHSRRLWNSSNGSEIRAEATTRAFGRGGRRAIVLLDEAAHIEGGLQSGIALSLETVAVSQWRVSTPNGRGNRFYTDWKNGHDSDKLRLGWQTDPRRDEGWFSGLIIENGGALSWDEREQEHNASFTAVSGIRVFRIDQASSYEDEELQLPRDHGAAKVISTMDFGSGPSATVLLAAILEYDGAELARVLVDASMHWYRTSGEQIGREAKEWSVQRYGRKIASFGDPSGIAADPGAKSWERRIRSGGHPLRCLPGAFNTRGALEGSIRLAQKWIDCGFLLIHAGEKHTWEAIEGWQFALPPGVRVEAVSRADIVPRKDGPSHWGNCLQMLVWKIEKSYMRRAVGADRVSVLESHHEEGGEWKDVEAAIGRME